MIAKRIAQVLKGLAWEKRTNRAFRDSRGQPTAYDYVHTSGEVEVLPTTEVPLMGFSTKSKKTNWMIWLPKQNKQFGPIRTNLKDAFDSANNYLSHKNLNEEERTVSTGD